MKHKVIGMKDNITKEEWVKIYHKHFKGCFQFWQREGYDMALSLEKAIEDTKSLKHNPFVPKGQEVDKKLLDEFCKKWSSIKNELLAGIQDGRYNDGIRTCQVCGLPMIEGYQLDEWYACDDECCLDVYDGNKAKMDEELSHAEENDSKNYYTKWDSIFFD